MTAGKARFANHATRAARAARGLTLIEALLALAIMALGMLGLSELQVRLRRHADIARQAGEALRLAQQDLETLRSFSVLSAASGAQSYDDIVSSGPNLLPGSNSNASYALTRHITASLEPSHKLAQVSISWQDRAGEAQSVTLSSVLARIDPTLAASLAMAPAESASSAMRLPGNRAAGIPVSAKDLGNRTSVFKPSPTGTLAWLFDNLSGQIIGRCTVPVASSSASLTSADVAACANNALGWLLSGFVRFSASNPPDALYPSDPALPLDLLLTNPAGPVVDHECVDDAPSSGNDSATTVRYHCAIYPALSVPTWSGRLLIEGIALGGSDWRICRYSADVDGDGRISNAEHPQDYRDVSGPLIQQNFLVVRAAQDCPAPADSATPRFVNSRTVLHQIHGLPALD
jgi:Tfp pilus assembly protein PilV